MPILLMIIGGIVDFGIILNNYLELTDGVRVAGRSFAIAGSSSTPMSSATTSMDNAAANLTAGSINITYSVNGVACTTDSGCQTALAAAAGQPATVTATYPCNTPIAGFSFLSSCTLSSSTTEMVE